MNDLVEQYRRAPEVKSPQRIDQAVMNHARGSVPDKPGPYRVLHWAPAVSMACVGLVGVWLVLRNGTPPLSEVAVESAEAISSREELSVSDLVAADIAEITVPGERVAEVQPPESAEPAVVQSHSEKQITGRSSSLVAREVTQSVAESGAQARTSKRSIQESRAETDGLPQPQGLEKALEKTADAADDWIDAQPESFFTVQFGSAGSSQQLAALRDVYSGIAGLVVLKVDATRWVVVSGSFASREEALQWLLGLPDAGIARVVSFGQLTSETH